MTDRIAKLKQMQAEIKPSLSSERARLATEAMDLYAQEPPVLQRAYMLDYILKNMTIYMEEGELIVGNHNDKPRCAPVFPEMFSEWVINEIDDFKTRPSDPLELTDEDREELLRILPKWKGRSFDKIVERALPEDTKEAEAAGIMTVGNRDCGTGHLLADYQTALNVGLKEYKRQCQEYIDNTVIQSKEDQEKVNFWNAEIISVDAAQAFALRYSELAKQQAAECDDPVRKAELLQISENCKIVPYEPAQTFHQAVQFVWFCHVIMNIEINGHGISLHRLDQYFNPFYVADLKAGRITEEFAIECLDCLFIKFTDILKLRDKFYSQSFAGYPIWQNMIVGGQLPDGSDATNETSFLVLKANRDVQTSQPTGSVRWHKNINPELVEYGLKMIQDGLATPAFFNDELVVPMVAEKLDISIEEARNWGIMGCVQPMLIGKGDGRPTVGYVNLLKCLELVLHNGYDPVAKKQLGVKTGELSTLTSKEKIVEALYTQIDHFVDLMLKGFNIVGAMHATRCPQVFASNLIQGCIDKGMSIQEGGPLHCESGAFINGIGNVTDAIAAIDTIIFQEKMYTMEELMTALEANFEGYERMRLILLNKAPKYGNDNDYVDAIAAGIVKYYADSLGRYRDSRGGKYHVVVESQSMNVSQGKCVLASADGRFAFEAVNDNCSPVMGRDVSGPTACVKSVAKLDQKNAKDGCLYNLRFDPRSVQGDKGRGILEGVVMTFFENGGEHVQINVVDSETLRAAQREPEKYRNLLVRVAGYLAYFTELDTDVQNNVISRTAHNPCC